MAVTNKSPKFAVFNESETIFEFRDKRILHFNIRVPDTLDLDGLAGRNLRARCVGPGPAITPKPGTKICLMTSRAYAVGTGCAQ